MKPYPGFFSDLAQITNGAASTLAHVKTEAHTVLQSIGERSQQRAGLVTREDFDALLMRVEALATRMTILEAQQHEWQQAHLAEPLSKRKKKGLNEGKTTPK